MPKSDGHPADTFFKHPKTIECLNALATELDNSLNEANASQRKDKNWVLINCVAFIGPFWKTHWSQTREVTSSVLLITARKNIFEPVVLLLESVIEFQEKYLSKKLDIPITRLPVSKVNL